MEANTWIWVALIAFLVFCCLPMLFMGRQNHKPADGTGDGHGAERLSERTRGDDGDGAGGTAPRPR